MYDWTINSSDKRYISVQTELDECTEFLSQLGGNQAAMRRRVLSAIGTGARQAVKKSYRNYLGKESGMLQKNITKKVVKSGKAVVIKAAARGKNQVFYGFALAKGSTIKAKNGDFLTFQIDDKWIKKKEIKLTPKPFVEEPITRYLKNGDARKVIEKQLNKEVERAAKKAAERAKK